MDLYIMAVINPNKEPKEYTSDYTLIYFTFTISNTCDDSLGTMSVCTAF